MPSDIPDRVILGIEMEELRGELKDLKVVSPRCDLRANLVFEAVIYLNLFSVLQSLVCGAHPTGTSYAMLWS